MKILCTSILILLVSFGYPQSNPCNDLDSLYESGQYEKAFQLLQLNRSWPCDEFRFKHLKSAVLIANLRFNEARYELAQLDGEGTGDLLKKLNLLESISAKRTGASLSESPQNSRAHNNLFLNLAEINLIDTQRVLTDFPLTVLSDKAYFPASDESNRLMRWLLTQNFLEILPGSSLNDSIGAITASIKRPFQKDKGQYNIVILALDELKILKTFGLESADQLMYPCVLDDRIIFASDRAGGEGGFDLWSVSWDGQSFGEVVNLGPEINSAFDEIYPIQNGAQLLFASNRSDLSFGGFDLFKFSEENGLENFGLPINSSSDDLNPIIREGRLGSIASQRDSEMFMLYNIQYVDTTEVFSQIIGRVEIEGAELGGKYMLLTNADSTQQARVLLDKDGYFRINQLKGLEEYEVSIPGLDFSGAKGRMVVYNDRGDQIADVKMNKYGVFALKLLKPEDYYLSKESNQDESILAVDIEGIFENEAESQFVIALENSNGDLIGLTRTDSTGNFMFEAVVPDDRYIIRTEVQNPNGVIRILNDKGETIQTIHPKDQNGYVHLRLNENDKVITITNEADRAVKISELETFKLPTIYFELDEAYLTDESKDRLSGFLKLVKKNPSVNIEITGHTDSRGDEDYNLNLSQKRVDAVLNFLVSSGVDAKRISGKGYGESKLINDCDDNTPCSDEEHAENRRTELRLYQDHTP